MFLATGDPTGIALPKDEFDKSVVMRLFENVVPRSRLGSRLPGAVAEVLIDSSRDGMIDEVSVRSLLGPSAARLVATLGKAALPADPIADRILLSHVSEDRKRALLSHSKAPKLPAVDFVTERIAKPGELAGMKLFALQHLFESTAGLFQGLASSGVSLDGSAVLGKVYSTNHHTAAWAEAAGMSVDRASTEVQGAFEATMRSSIRARLRAIIAELPHPPEAKPTPRVLLLDDGAEAIKLLHDEFREYAPYFIGVEQTRRGARLLHGMELAMPVANVAESWAKLELESPMIGHSVVVEVQKKLDELEGYGIEAGRSAVVVGFGAVGAHVAKSLAERGLEVHVFDVDPEKRRAAEKAGFSTHRDLTDALEHGHVLVSCVGRRTLSKADYDLLPNGAILVNAASADDELGSNLGILPQSRIHVDGDGYVWSKFQAKPVCLGLGTAEAHSDKVVRQPTGKELLLVNRGYVVNMTGERDPIPPRYIQLTRALLMAGAIAAKRSGESGLVDVPRSWQEAIVKKVEHELAKTKEKLTAPSWDLLEAKPKAIRSVPEEARQLRDGTELEAFFPKVTVPSNGDEERVFGYQLGPVREGSREAYVDQVMGDGDGILSPIEAGLDRALLAVNRHFRVEVAAAMRASSPGLISQTGSIAEQRRAAGSPRDDFVASFAHFLVALTEAALKAAGDRQATVGAPTEGSAEERLVGEVRAILSTSAIPLAAVKDSLSRGSEAERWVAERL